MLLIEEAQRAAGRAPVLHCLLRRRHRHRRRRAVATSGRDRGCAYENMRDMRLELNRGLGSVP